MGFLFVVGFAIAQVDIVEEGAKHFPPSILGDGRGGSGELLLDLKLLVGGNAGWELDGTGIFGLVGGRAVLGLSCCVGSP